MTVTLDIHIKDTDKVKAQMIKAEEGDFMTIDIEDKANSIILFLPGTGQASYLNALDFVHNMEKAVKEAMEVREET